MSAITMLGGSLIIIQGVVNIVVADPPLQPPEPLLGIVKSIGFAVVGAISVVAGLIVLYAGWLISQGKKVRGSRIAVLFAIVGFAGGGGFIIGTILGLAGGFMNWRVID